MLGQAIINGLPALGLPKISNCVDRIRRPTLAAQR
jgi:hypothetical protein